MGVLFGACRYKQDCFTMPHLGQYAEKKKHEVVKLVC